MYGCENSGFLEMCTKQPTKRETCDQHPIKIECVPCYMRCGYEYVQSRVCMGFLEVLINFIHVWVKGTTDREISNSASKRARPRRAKKESETKQQTDRKLQQQNYTRPKPASA